MMRLVHLEAGMRVFIGALLLAFLPVGLGKAWCLGSSSQDTADPVAIYDPNPTHLWNRLHSVLFIREDLPDTKLVPDSLDPPLWGSTRYLLTAPSNERVLRILDEFLQTHAERLIQDPVKRAILQRDLWAVFDWTVARVPEQPGKSAYNNERQELQARLAEVMRRLALTPEEIHSLPNNYERAVVSGQFAKEYDPQHPDLPFLPPDLFDLLGGPWVALYAQGPSSEPVAARHVSTFSRSSFVVFVRLPGGRKATFDYFQTLWDFPQPWIPRQHEQTIENPDLPQFPAGTQVALVRQMMLFDNRGNLEGTPITESVQIRVYRTVPTQDFYEIRLSRPQLFANRTGGLRAAGRNEKEFFILSAFGPDEGTPNQYTPLDKYPLILETCVTCHRGGGITSLNSRGHLLKPYWLNHEYSAGAYGPDHKWWEETQDMGWKQNRYEWGLLNGYWKSNGGLH
jgi:hypothetical protein